MKILEGMKNLASGIFIQNFGPLTGINARVARKQKNSEKRTKQILDAIESTGKHHREALFKKWGW